MRALVASALATGLLVVLQLIVWRWRRPVRQYATLLGLAAGVMAAAAGPWSAGGVPPWPLPASALDLLNFVALYLAVVMAYMTTFSAVQADSPTMSIVLLIQGAGGRGLSVAELCAELDDDALVVPRLTDLVTGQLVRVEGDRYVINRRGIAMARPHLLYRAALGMERGG